MKEKQYPLFLDFLPLILFFILNRFYGIYVATGFLVITSIITFVLGYIFTKKFHPVPVVTTILAVLFGSLTVLLHDENFIKFKVTLLNLVFASALIIGLLFKKNFLKLTFGPSLKITPQGWKVLTTLWITFFLLLALINEVIWRNVSTDTWVNFKVFGVLVLTIIFCLIQIPIIMKHKLHDNNQKNL